jgi:RNA polymerase sigma-70 factor (ECF subfamily)
MHGSEPALTPEEETIRTQLREVLAAFLETLDGVERQIVDEHLLGELSQRDMAEALGVDRNELRRRLKGIRERLLRHLKASGFISDMDPSELLQSLMVFSWLK